MATQTVRTIYEAVVNGAQANLGRLARETDKAATSVDKLDKSLDSAGKRTVDPKIDVDIKAAEKEVRRLTKELDDLGKLDSEVKVDAEIDEATNRLDSLREDLRDLEALDASPEVDVQIGQAEAEIQGVLDELEVLDGRKAEAVADADISAAQSALSEAEAELSALQGAKAEMVVEADASGVSEAFDEAQADAEQGGEDAGMAGAAGIATALKSSAAKRLVAGGVVGLIGYAGVELNKAAINWVGMGLGPNLSEDQFGARAGVDEATARQWGAAAGTAYANAWGESMEANLGTAQAALNNALVPDDATQAEMRDMIEQLTAVSDIVGVDVTEAAEAAGTMMKNGLAASAEEAFDVIISGQQEGLNRSQDWIDTLREYSPMFESIGLSGAEAGGLIEQAMDAGARNSDVAADALKEFSIRAQDDSKLTREAFESMGLDADEMGAAIAAGGDTAAEGLDTVLDGLREIEDPVQRNLAGVALFGTMWEDMGNGAGILAMDLDSLGESWVQVGDTTEDAMARMQDNAATSLEKTQRTVENTITQLAGGMAAAWEEPIQGVTEWILSNRSTILEYMLAFRDGFFDAARAAVEFAANLVEAGGIAAGALAPIVEGLGLAVQAAGALALNEDMINFGRDIQDAGKGMEDFSDSAEDAAATMRNDWIAAIDETEAATGSWDAPLLLRAQLDDAIYQMTGRLDEFSTHVDNSGGTVTINGNELPAEEALNTLISEVDGSDGTVTINGQTVPADQALDVLIDQVNSSDGSITIHGNNAPAKGEAAEAASYADRQHGTIHVGADAASANREINNAARDRWSTIRVSYSVVGGVPQARFGNGMIASGRALGGTIPGDSGYMSGYGIVPGPSAPYGVDNVLWPDYSGAPAKGYATGGQLSRPLAGGEWVVNPISSRQHDATLRAINAGASRAELAASLGAIQSSGITMYVNPQVPVDSDPTVFGRRVGESLRETLRGIKI